MKKLVGLLVFAVLVLAGCSADNALPTRMPEANQPAGEKQDAVNSPEVKIPETVPANESETMNQESADWQVYSNSRYSYSIKYPANWFIDTAYSEEGFSPRGSDNELIGGDTRFTNMDLNLAGMTPEDLIKVNESLYELSLKVYQIDANSTYEQFLSSKNFAYDKMDSVTINGLSAIKLTGVTTDSPVGVTVVNTLIKVADKMFAFNYSGNPLSDEEREAAEGIINSFMAN